jgi:hypothetical protein
MEMPQIIIMVQHAVQIKQNISNVSNITVQRNREKKRKSNMTKEVWEKGEEGAKILLEYVKNFGLYYGL